MAAEPAVVRADDPAAVEVAATALRVGETVLLPTETVYGVGALPSVPGATSKLFALKGRPAAVPVAVLVASADEAWTLAAAVPPDARRLAERFWPGPLTLVLRRHATLAVELGGDAGTVGVRCPDHALIRTLAESVGPIATTSANRHGEPTPATAAAAAAALAGPVAVVVDGGPLSGQPSTVVDLTGGDLRVLRAGPVTEADLRRAAG
jgi:L-threonylcarbamoyladenylate synthase